MITPCIMLGCAGSRNRATISTGQQIVEVSKSFRDIPGVLDVRAGQAVLSDRKIVDDSFDVAILVIVPDQKRLAEYLAHPVHQKAKSEILLPLVDRIVVYDFKE